MTVGIIGLGLIGGSLAKAFCREEGNTVLGWDTDSTIVEFAQIAQAIHGPLTDERLGELDLLLLATYPEAVVEHMTRLAPLLSKHTMVIDCAGTKEKVCAFTSQMAHVISNAYIKSPTARNHDGFSAGSYKDLTRVAWLNPAMWAELFLENRENLLFELDTLIRSLEQYREAIQEDDFAALCQLLEEGRRIKEEVDGT